jgi:hypothetical protein
MVQTWDVPFTPRQRWILMQLALSPEAGNITTGVEGKAFRRALRAFGLVPIRDALGTGTSVSDRMAYNTTPSLFKITAENVETAAKWAAVPRHPTMEMDVGDALDLLDQLRADPAKWFTPPDVPMYDPALEDWRPAPDVDEVTALELVALIVNDPNRPDDPTRRPVACWTAADWQRAQDLVARSMAPPTKST